MPTTPVDPVVLDGGSVPLAEEAAVPNPAPKAEAEPGTEKKPDVFDLQVEFNQYLAELAKMARRLGQVQLQLGQILASLVSDAIEDGDDVRALMLKAAGDVLKPVVEEAIRRIQAGLDALDGKSETPATENLREGLKLAVAALDEAEKKAQAYAKTAQEAQAGQLAELEALRKEYVKTNRDLEAAQRRVDDMVHKTTSAEALLREANQELASNRVAFDEVGKLKAQLQDQLAEAKAEVERLRKAVPTQMPQLPIYPTLPPPPSFPPSTPEKKRLVDID